jgi:CHAD domain-containing protein
MTRSPDRRAPFRTRLDVFITEAERIHHGGIEALHHTRVASRRLRELLPILELQADAARTLGARLKKVTRRLGPVRELDVMAVMIETLERDQRFSSAALRLVGAAVAESRAAERERLAEKLPVAKLERLARALERAARHIDSSDWQRTLPSPQPRQSWMWALEARVSHRASRARSAIEAAGVVYLPDRLHAARIALKKLRYAVELLSEARHRPLTPHVATLKQAQDLLGRLHDLQGLINRTREVQAAIALPDLLAWRRLGSLMRALDDECRRLHARYVRDRARLIAVTHRVEATRPQPVSASHLAAS